LVEHLDELRTRLIVSLAVLVAAFGLCMWQNHTLLRIVNRPLEHQTQKQVRAGNGPLGATYAVQQGARSVGVQLERVVGALERPRSGASAATRATLQGVRPQLHRAISRLSGAPQGNKPVTLGIGEPFTATLGIALLFALILALPIVLYELYSFMLPALGPEHQRVVSPLIVAVPVLFVVGVLFGYFVVLPAALRFFENFNSDQFNVLVQASQYYHFRASCAPTAATRSLRAVRWRRSCPATRLPCCWRRCRCTSSSRGACCWRRSSSGAPSAGGGPPPRRSAAVPGRSVTPSRAALAAGLAPPTQTAPPGRNRGAPFEPQSRDVTIDATSSCACCCAMQDREPSPRYSWWNRLRT